MQTPENQPTDYPVTPPVGEKPSLSERVSAAQTRIAESTAPARERAAQRAGAAAGSLKNFANEHPLLTVAGGLAAGAAIALALPGRPGRKVRGSVLAVGGLIAELAASYGSKMLAMAEDAAEASQEKLGEIGESFAETGHSLADTAAEAADGARSRLAGASNAVARQSQSIASRLRR